jgi:murein DD-endopeptidase MepM/ murein hydrolase activator NlpD
MAAYNKVFFHAGPVCSCTGIGDLFGDLDEANIPFGHKTADEYGTAWEASQYANATTVWRLTTKGQNDGRDYDVPDYSLPPADAALKHWLITKAKLPPEFNKNTWIEPINEVDKERADWLGYFALAIASMANGEGYKVSLFAFSAGEPEADDWETPGMLAYLEYCADHPNEAAVSLHEYSLTKADLFEGFPYLVGRFQFLHDVCDDHGIARPTIFISEFGWEYQNVPDVPQAMAEITLAASLYAAHPNIEFAAIWYLGGGSNWPNIGQQTQRLIEPIKNYSLTAEFPDPPEQPEEPPMDCNPRVPYSRKYLVAPQDATLAEWIAICEAAFPGRNSVTFSYDDAGHAPGVTSNTAVLHGIPVELQQLFIDWYAGHYPGTAVEFADEPAPPAPPLVNLIYRPCQTTNVTQSFGANPGSYDDFGLPGHDGTDYGVGKDLPFYAAAAGTVVHASDRKWSNNTASGYGWHVVLNHGDYCTVYAHARPDLPVSLGQPVAAGQIVGYSGNTGNSTGYHLHFGVLDKTGTIDPNNDYPVWFHGRPVNPWPFVQGKPAPQVAPPPAPTIDLLPYFQPSGQYGRYVVFHFTDGRTQAQQMEKLPNGRTILWKGEGQWFDNKQVFDYEEVFVDSAGVKKFTDTSSGGRSAYDLDGIVWLPRMVEVGKVYQSSPTVREFDRVTCQTTASNQTVDYIYVKALLPVWTSPVNPAISFEKVLVCEWRKTPDINTPAIEVYKLAPDVMYCEWNNGAVGELPEGRQPLSFQLTNCV